MSATSLLVILIAVFVILNANNFTQVIQGKIKFSFAGSGSRTPTSTYRTPVAGRGGNAPQ